MPSRETPSSRDAIDNSNDLDSSDEADNDEEVACSSDEEEEGGDLVSSPIASSPSDLAGDVSSRGLVRAIAAYVAEDDSELTICEGDLVEVMEMAPSGWWRGRRGLGSD